MKARKHTIKNTLSGETGFTLIELLIVILIIGILATLALPRYAKVVRQAKMTEATVILGAVRTAQEAYRLEHGTYSPDIYTTTWAKWRLGIDLPPSSERYFDYGARLDISNSDNEDPEARGNTYTAASWYNRQDPAFVEHPHIHETGDVGIWLSSTESHSHGFFSHTHNLWNFPETP